MKGKKARSPAPERPQAGGSYIRDKATGRLRRVVAAPQPTVAEPAAAEPPAPETADAPTPEQEG